MTEENKSKGSLKLGVKRSIHFVLPSDFASTINKVTTNLSREFWQPIDKLGSSLRKKLRDVAWTVWLSGGPNTFSMNYVHHTQLVINKTKSGFAFQLKEVGGKLTDLNVLPFYEKSTDDPDDPINITKFDLVWKELMKRDQRYPNQSRPVTSAVAQVISSNYEAPIPVVLTGIVTNFLPTELSNGLLELYKKSMPNEVFPEEMVVSGAKNGETERVDYWTFKVVKRKYSEWQMRRSTSGWRTIQ